MFKAWGCSRESRIGMANPNVTCLRQPPKISRAPTFPVPVVMALKRAEGTEGTWGLGCVGMATGCVWCRDELEVLNISES